MYWIKMASAIMTTDTKPKLAYEEVIIGDELIKISGIAKGFRNDRTELGNNAFIYFYKCRY
jgi:hypothetical protein